MSNTAQENIQLGISLLPIVAEFVAAEQARTGKTVMQILIDSQAGFAANAKELDASRALLQAMIDAPKESQ